MVRAIVTPATASTGLMERRGLFCSLLKVAPAAALAFQQADNGFLSNYRVVKSRA
jgi:hypothetical protein